MGGEDVAGPGGGESGVERLLAIVHEPAGPLEHGKGGVAFVEMADLGIQTEGSQQTPTDNAENVFLTQPQFGSAAVQLAGDARIRGRIGGIVGVEEIEPGAPHFHLPGANPQFHPGERNRQPHPLAIGITQRLDGQLAGLVVRVESQLRAAGIELLAEVTLLVEQADADHRHAQIAGGFQLISRDVAEAARVNGQSLAQHIFHAEVCDGLQRRIGKRARKPAGRLHGFTLGLQQLTEALAERGVVQSGLEFLARDSLENGPRIVGQLPEFGVELAPEFPFRRIPGPAQVQGQFGQRLGRGSAGEQIGFRGLAHTLIPTRAIRGRRGPSVRRPWPAPRIPRDSWENRGVAARSRHRAPAAIPSRRSRRCRCA